MRGQVEDECACADRAIRAAVAEAREQCATMADLFMFKTEGRSTAQAYADVSHEIAAAIRAQPSEH